MKTCNMEQYFWFKLLWEVYVPIVLLIVSIVFFAICVLVYAVSSFCEKKMFNKNDKNKM